MNYYQRASFLNVFRLLFRQDNLSSTRRAVINDGPAIEVLILFKAPI